MICTTWLVYIAEYKICTPYIYNIRSVSVLLFCAGTSDPYVKFRLGEQKYRSKTIMKDLNPKWDEAFILWTSLLQEPLRIKVYDYDRGMTDDFMGECEVDLVQLQPNQ